MSALPEKIVTLNTLLVEHTLAIGSDVEFWQKERFFFRSLLRLHRYGRLHTNVYNWQRLIYLQLLQFKTLITLFYV
jgi:hypothetical protein